MNKESEPGQGGPYTFTIRSIGVIHTPFHSPGECPRQGSPAGVEGEVSWTKTCSRL